MLRPLLFASFLVTSGAVAFAQTAQQAAVRVEAAVQASPPAIVFTWPAEAGATSYTVRRRAPGSLVWGVPAAVPGGGSATTWTDAAVATGARYEYWFQRAGSPAGNGFATAGIAADAIEDRGKVVLLVDASKVASLGGRLDRLVEDLVGDGYGVLRHDVAPGTSVPAVRALVAADYAAHLGQVTTVFVLGHVPVPYSGSIAPDGHVPDHYGAWPADVFYGEMNGLWTDTSVNNIGASRVENRNVPGDGKFDQSSLPSDVDLGVGRVDFANMPSFAAGEDALLAAYLDKDHDWRHKAFTAGQQAVIDDNFGWFGGEAFAASGWRAFSALVGTANVVAADYFGTLNVSSGPGHVWSNGCGGGWFSGASGVGSTTDFAASGNRTVFTMLFGSYFGDWDSTDNFLRAPLCQGWTLASVWAGRPHWQFHPMALGASLGQCARLSQNDTSAAGLSSRSVHVALMGDPTLRQHVIAPPTAAAVADLWPAASLGWNASADPVAGYHVYRAASPGGPFVRISPAVVAGTTFVDAAPLAGPSTYMVRAIRLETAPTGTYWNLSQGSFASVTLPTAPASHTAYGSGCHGVSIAVSPAPVSTPTAGTLLTYTVSGVPETSPGSGVHFGVTIVSPWPNPSGTPLDSLGLPGCVLWVGGLDILAAFVGSSPVQSTPLTVPPGMPGGSQFFATAIVLVDPGTLNPFGGAMAGGIASSVNAF